MPRGKARSGEAVSSVIVLLAFIAKVSIAFNTFGATDVVTWRSDVAKLKRDGVESLYRDGITYSNPDGSLRLYQPFIHPPFIVHLLRAWDALERATSLPMQFWMRLACAAADVVSALLLREILRLSLYQVGPCWGSLLIVALSPISLMISGFHGNTDPVMVAFVVGSVYFMEVRGMPVAAGAALGAALSIKVAALIFAPVLLLYCGRKSFRFVLAAAATVFVLSSPYLITSTKAVVSVIGPYSSQYGVWGFSRFASAVGGDANGALLIAAKVMLIASIVVCAVQMNRSGSHRPLLLQCAVAAFAFLAISPGFGVQYLAWTVPWSVALSIPLAVAYQLAGGVFLFLYYNRAAHGLPWYFADSLHTPVWYGSVVWAGLICWVICWASLLLALRSRIGSKSRSDRPRGARFS